MRVDFHPAATAELESSADWYAERSEIAARKFVLAVQQTLRKISDDPERFPFILEKYQACSLERFPFQIVFRNEAPQILVLAIAHAKRRPGYWTKRH